MNLELYIALLHERIGLLHRLIYWTKAHSPFVVEKTPHPTPAKRTQPLHVRP